MSERTESFMPTCPAATGVNVPIEIPTIFLPGFVERISVTIPHGHASLTGIQVLVGHTQYLPRAVGAWITGDSLTKSYSVHSAPNSGSWSVRVYNTDRYDHYWTVEYEVRELTAATASVLPFDDVSPPKPDLPVSQLGGILLPQGPEIV